MKRIIKYIWFRFIMVITGWMPDFWPILCLRGFLIKPAFKKCGRNFRIQSGTTIIWSSNISIGDNVEIATNCWIQGVGEICLEDEVGLGPFTVLESTNHMRKNGSWRFGPSSMGKITIGRGTWICAHVVITAGVTIGRGSVVGAGAVVTKNIPDNCLAVGVPAKVIKHLDS